MATETKSEISAGKPPYIPYETLSGFIARLKETTVPTAIDKSMMSKVAGGMQSYLLAALRFLGLTEGKANEVTPALEKLVEAHGTEGHKPAMAEIITAAYADTIEGVDLTKATAKQLDDAFGKHNIDGVVRDRAIRFYLKALAEADIRFSPLLVARKPKGSVGNGSKPRKPKTNAGNGEAAQGSKPKTAEPHEHEHETKGTQKYPLYFKNKPAGSIVVPADLTPADCKVIELMLAVLKQYAASGDDE